MSPVVFYHIYATEFGYNIAVEQLNKLNVFIPNAMIYCGIVEAENTWSDKITEFINRTRIARIIARAESGNEWTTISNMYQRCCNDFSDSQPILYCHTKGAYSTHLKPEIIPKWREWMEYFCFFKYHWALESLNSGYSTYGFDAWCTPRRNIMLRLGFRPKFRFYSGNYWWSTAKNIRRINTLGINKEQRHSAEGDFLSRIPRIRPKEALNYIGLNSILAGAYTNYRDDFRFFHVLQQKEIVLEDMRLEFMRSVKTSC